jgi:hypothetical protein
MLPTSSQAAIRPDSSFFAQGDESMDCRAIGHFKVSLLNYKKHLTLPELCVQPKFH